MTSLTEPQIRILEGLSLSGGNMVAASEMPEVRPLDRAGYVVTWRADGGFRAWAITDAGRAALAGLKERGRGDAS
ncbi:hypothetical protein ACLBX9_30920 [Methylobacterium sp. A49B]